MRTKLYYSDSPDYRLATFANIFAQEYWTVCKRERVQGYFSNVPDKIIIYLHFN